MRKLLTWLVVTVGIAALVRRLRRRPKPPARPLESVSSSNPADELRQKLAESRSQAASDGSTQATVAERRAEVHGDARAALDEMRARVEP